MSILIIKDLPVNGLIDLTPEQTNGITGGATTVSNSSTIIDTGTGQAGGTITTIQSGQQSTVAGSGSPFDILKSLFQ